MINIQSIKARLANYARKHGIPYERAYTSLLLERAVVRLVSNEKLKRHLCFKGGYVALREYDLQRFTKDIDAAVLSMTQSRAVLEAKKAMAQNLVDGVWFTFFEKKAIAGQSGYKGISLRFRAGIGEPIEKESRHQIIDIDLGIGDVVIPKPLAKRLKPILADEEVSWSIYSIESIIAEKFHSLVVFGDSSGRSKDIYDLSVLLDKVNSDSFKQALNATFAARDTHLPSKIVDFLQKLDTAVLKRGWQNSISSISSRPEFDETFGKVISFFKEMGL